MSLQAVIRRHMLRITCLPQLLCYPELKELSLEDNLIGTVAEQRGLSALERLDMSSNQLQHVSMLRSLRLLVSLTDLRLEGNAMEQDPRQVCCCPLVIDSFCPPLTPHKQKLLT